LHTFNKFAPDVSVAHLPSWQPSIHNITEMHFENSIQVVFTKYFSPYFFYVEDNFYRFIATSGTGNGLVLS